MNGFRYVAIIAGKITRGVVLAFDAAEARSIVRSHFDNVANVDVRPI